MEEYDPQLLAFLKAYRPTPPPPPPHHEVALMTRIAHLRPRGIGPLASLLILVVAGSLGFQRVQPQVVLSDQERQAIVTSLIEDWDVVTGGEHYQYSEVYLLGGSDG